MFFGLFKKRAPFRPPAVIGTPLFKPHIVKRDGHWVIAMPGTGDYRRRAQALEQLVRSDASTKECVHAAHKFIQQRNQVETRNRALATLGLPNSGVRA